jgi:hypothetical protein
MSLVAHLLEEHLSEISDPSFIPNKKGALKMLGGNQSAASVDRGHLH